MRAIIKGKPEAAYNGDTVALTVLLDGRHRQEIWQAINAISASEKPYEVVIERKKKRRSLNANAYCWVLCQSIAEQVGTTKEAVYKKNIAEVGSFEVIDMVSEAVDRFIERWQKNGIGWVAEPHSVKDGYTSVIAYYGSSTYDTKEMARLIDALIAEAKSVGVETMTPDEIARLKDEWQK